MTIRSGGSTNILKGSTIAGGSVQGWSLSQNNVARQLMYYYLSAGMSKAGAAGMIGNQMQESSLNPADQGGYLSQWRGARFSNLLSFAAMLGLPATSVEAQARFTVHELKTGYPQLFSYLQSASRPDQAALQISKTYERPGIPMNANRERYAIQAFNGLTGANYSPPDGSGTPSQGNSTAGGVGSILDLLTAPVPTLGGWLASIVATVVKDSAIAIGDTIVIPFWHWNQRTAAAYQSQMFSSGGSNMLIWTGVFWGLGYWLLFTNPDQGKLARGPVATTPLARQMRLVQAIPARRELIKPSEVISRTPKKPEPVVSYAPIKIVDTASTHRAQRVMVKGSSISGNATGE